MIEINMHVRGRAALRLLALGTAVALLAGCAGPVRTVAQAGPVNHITGYTVNGVHYTTATDALAAERRANDGYVEGVHHEADPITGSVRIILPDHDRLRPLVMQNLFAATKRQVIGQALDYYIDRDQLLISEAAKAILTSSAFEQGSTVVQNDVLDPPQGDADYLVWFQVRTALPNNTGAWIGHWLVRRKGSPTTAPAAFDPGTAAGAPRYDSFIKSVRQAALRLGGHSRSGITLSSPQAGIVSSGTFTASGVIIDGKGHILTNDHVIRSCIAPKVTDSANHRFAATVIARDSQNDLALLETKHRWPDTATLRDGQEPRRGDAVVVAGYPLHELLGSGVTVTTGSLSALTGPQDDSRFIQISAPIQLGNSGGPVLDSSGRLVGIVDKEINGLVVALLTGGAVPQNVNFALKTAIIRNFLDTHDIAYAHAAPGRTMDGGEVGTQARHFTVLITCKGA